MTTMSKNPIMYTSLRNRKGNLVARLGKLTNIDEASDGLLWLERESKSVFKQSIITTLCVKVCLFDALTGEIIEDFQETEPCRKILALIAGTQQTRRTPCSSQ
jgi:hypothetical protein